MLSFGMDIVMLRRGLEATRNDTSARCLTRQIDDRYISRIHTACRYSVSGQFVATG